MFSIEIFLLSSGLSYRFLHTTPLLEKKAISKVEETVVRLKERQNEALAELSKVEDLEKKIASVIEAEDLVSYDSFTVMISTLNLFFFVHATSESNGRGI